MLIASLPEDKPISYETIVNSSKAFGSGHFSIANEYFFSNLFSFVSKIISDKSRETYPQLFIFSPF